MNSRRNGNMMRAMGAVGVTALLASCGTQVAEPFTPDNLYHADLNPLNVAVQGAEAAHGGATVTLEGNVLTVRIQSDGLTPNQPHPQHIHGFTGAFAPNAVCPPEEARDDDPQDDLTTISVGEGAPYYGPVQIPLVDQATLPADFNNIPVSAWPVADAEGRIDYNRTFTLTDAQRATITPLYKMAIVQHGADTNGAVEGGFVATLPVNCGTITVGAVD